MFPYIQQYNRYYFSVSISYGGRWHAEAWGCKHATELHEIYGCPDEHTAIREIKKLIDEVSQGLVI